MPMQYNLAHFDPFTYEQLAKPLELATELHNQYDDALGTLATQASVWEKLANSALDQNEYQVYKSYADKVKMAATLLMTLGLSGTSRTQLNQLKAQYALDIVPISEAWTLREKAREQEAKEDSLFGRGTILRERSAFNRGLGDYKNGLPESNAVNLQLVETRVALSAAALSKLLRHAASVGRLDTYTKTLTEQHGFSEAEIDAFMKNPADPKASNILQMLYASALELTGILNWLFESPESQVAAQAAVHNAIGRGLLHAIGETKMSTFADQEAKYRHEEAVAARAAAAKASAGAGINAPRLNNRYSNKRRTAIEQGLKDYSKYITIVDGKPQLTEEGKKEFHRQIDKKSPGMVMASVYTGGGSTSDYHKVPSPFRAWYNEYVRGTQNSSGQTPNEQLVALDIYEIMLHNYNFAADGVRNSFLEFNVEDNADREKIKNNLIRSTSGEFQEYDYSDDGKSLVPTGGKMSRKDLNDADTKILGTLESALGTLVVVADKDNKIHYIKADIDTDYSRQNILRVYGNIGALEQMRQNSILLENTLKSSGTSLAENMATLLSRMFDPTTGTGSYIDRSTYETLIAQQWNLILDYRAWSIRGITANPLAYGYSSTNTLYPGER